MGIECVRLDQVIEAVDCLLKRLAQDNASAPPDQCGEHGYFTPLQHQLRSTNPCFAKGHVEHKIADDDLIRCKFVRAALHGPDASKHFLQVERFHQVIVGAIEPGYAVAQFPASAQHND